MLFLRPSAFLSLAESAESAEISVASLLFFLSHRWHRWQRFLLRAKALSGWGCLGELAVC